MQLTHVIVVPSQRPEQQSEPCRQPKWSFGRQLTHVNGIDWGSQMPEQQSEGPVQLSPFAVQFLHVPLEQIWPESQVVVQLPQWLVFELVSTQEPLQSVWPLGHPPLHTPPEQLCPLEQQATVPPVAIQGVPLEFLQALQAVTHAL
jgi:hypothetical protein